jgi:hypothetical protein
MKAYGVYGTLSRELTFAYRSSKKESVRERGRMLI